MPQSEEEKKAYRKEYYQRPRVKARILAYAKSYYNRPEVKGYHRSPEYRGKDKARKQLPGYRAKRLIWDKKYRDKPERKALRYKQKYGFSLSDKNAMLIKQGGTCAICGTERFNAYGPCVDHDHITGKIRGIVCSNCNVALGLLHDNILTLKKMIQYLKLHRVS